MRKDSINRVYQVIGLGFLLVAIAALAWGIYLKAGPSSPPPPQVLVEVPPSPPAAPTGTPLDIFNSHHPPLTELAAWAKQWQAGWGATSRPSDASELVHLKELIQKSGLDADDQLTVGDYILHKGDKDVAATWFRSAIPQTEREWQVAVRQAGSGHDAEVDEAVLRPLFPKGLDEAGVLFWEPGYQDGAMEEILSRMELGIEPKNPWDQRPLWVKIGHSEALMDMGRYDEALAEANALDKDLADDDSHFTQHMKTEMHWNKALIFNSMKRYQDSVSELQIVVGDSKFTHVKEAWPILVQTLCTLHRGAEAENAYKTYQKNYQIDQADMLALSGMVDEAKYNEQWEKSH